MECLVCGEEFIIERNLRNLFSFKRYYCCNKCIEKYKFNINFNHIPINDHELVIVSLFDKDYKVNYSGFILEYSEVYTRLMTLLKDEIIIPYDKVFLSSEFIENFSNFSTLLDKNIYILTYVLIV